MAIRLLDALILDEASVNEIRHDIDQSLDGVEKPRLCLDFSRVEHLSSWMLGQLLVIHKQMARRRGAFCVVNLTPQVREIFTVTQLDRRLKVFETTRQVNEYFRGNGHRKKRSRSA